MKSHVKAIRRNVVKARTKQKTSISVRAARHKKPGDSNPARKLPLTHVNSRGKALSHQQRRRQRQAGFVHLRVLIYLAFIGSAGAALWACQYIPGVH